MKCRQLFLVRSHRKFLILMQDGVDKIAQKNLDICIQKYKKCIKMQNKVVFI